MRVARFAVKGRFDMASVEQDGTLTITIYDDGRGIVTVRPKGKRQTYIQELNVVADWVVKTNVTQTAAEAKPKRKYKAKRGLLSVGR